jgi:hypothetical protein
MAFFKLKTKFHAVEQKDKAYKGGDAQICNIPFEYLVFFS